MTQGFRRQGVFICYEFIAYVQHLRGKLHEGDKCSEQPYPSLIKLPQKDHAKSIRKEDADKFD